MSYVYKLLQGEEVVYVGKSTNLQSRLVSHRRVIPFDKVLSAEVPLELLNGAEKYLISSIKPTLNKVWKDSEPEPTLSGVIEALVWKDTPYYKYDMDIYDDSEYVLPSSLLKNRSLSASEKLLWVAMYRTFKDCGNNQFSEKLTTTAERLGMVAKTAERSLKTLMEYGHVVGHKEPVAGGGKIFKWVFDHVDEPM